MNQGKDLLYVSPRLPEQLGQLEDLRKIHWADLYLASACSLADPAAISALERYFIGPVLRRVSAKYGESA